jgi:hypothetical protein
MQFKIESNIPIPPIRRPRRRVRTFKTPFGRLRGERTGAEIKWTLDDVPIDDSRAAALLMTADR